MKKDIDKLNQKIQAGDDINDWIIEHIPHQIKKVCGLKSVNVEFIPDSFDPSEITFSDGTCEVKYYYFMKMSEYDFEQLISDIITTCAHGAMHK